MNDILDTYSDHDFVVYDYGHHHRWNLKFVAIVFVDLDSKSKYAVQSIINYVL